MEMISALLALCEGNPKGNGGISSQIVSHMELWSFIVTCLNKLLKKQQSCQWFERPRHSCYIIVIINGILLWRDVCGDFEEAAITKETSPELNPDDAEDKEDKEAKKKHVAEHRKRIQQQHDQDAHTWKKDIVIKYQ